MKLNSAVEKRGGFAANSCHRPRSGRSTFAEFRITSCVAFFALLSASSASGAGLADPGEQAEWDRIAKRFTGEPVVEMHKGSTTLVAKISVKGMLTGTTQNEGSMASVETDPASGRVIRFTSNGARITNEEIKGLAAFQKLESLPLWHNGPMGGQDAALYDGSALTALAKLENLHTVNFSGGAFDDHGMEALAKLPALIEFGGWHNRITDAGIAFFRNHPTIESLAFGAFWEQRISDDSLDVLSTCPKLRKLRIMETYLTWKGLSKLVARKETLKEVDLGNSLIDPADVERLRAELPGVQVKWEGLAGAGKVFAGSSWHKSKAEKWIPKELLDRAIAAAPAPAPATPAPAK